MLNLHLKMNECWEDDGFLDFKELESQITQFVDKSEILEMLKIQVSEFDMLQSMFPNPGEFEVNDYSIIADINEYIEGKISKLPSQLNFTIYLSIDTLKLQVCVNLPHEYPADEPDIFVRSDSLTRTQQHSLNCDLINYIYY
uniref:RWD domain-containing protein n=1 Tax=Clastoptera arizonana TaxID=38151 RepID=A0A1B6CTB9_9HEMI